MQAYLASEVLGPSDTWHCPKCRQDVRAKKALDLWCLSEVLIIHLKRFSYSGSGYYATMSSKIDNLVDFPLEVLYPSQSHSCDCVLVCVRSSASDVMVQLISLRMCWGCAGTRYDQLCSCGE